MGHIDGTCGLLTLRRIYPARSRFGIMSLHVLEDVEDDSQGSTSLEGRDSNWYTRMYFLITGHMATRLSVCLGAQ